jgi:hypothetical protein
MSEKPHADDALDATLLVSIVLDAHRHHRQLQRRLSHLDPLRQLLVQTCVENLADDRIGLPETVAMLRQTLDGSDTAIRKAMIAIRSRAGERSPDDDDGSSAASA